MKGLNKKYKNRHIIVSIDNNIIKDIKILSNDQHTDLIELLIKNRNINEVIELLSKNSSELSLDIINILKQLS
jgi:hypothetical protein